VFSGLPTQFPSEPSVKLHAHRPQVGTWPGEDGLSVPWRFLPAHKHRRGAGHWLVVLGEDESMDAPPAWGGKALGDVDVLLVAPRGSGPLRWQDPAPSYIRRSLPLLGRTVDSCRLVDTLAAAAGALHSLSSGGPWKIAGRGSAGVVAAYAAVFEPRLAEAVMVDPPASHRERPIFLNVLRVADLPEMLGLLAPRPLTIYTARSDDFALTAGIYHLAGHELVRQAWP